MGTEPVGTPQGITQLLLAWRDGNPEALDELTPIVYGELRRLAHQYMRREADQDVLQTTALVHEAYLRLIGEDIAWEGREHFFAIAATVMRRILVDLARRRQAKKRGGDEEVISLSDVEAGSEPLTTAEAPLEILVLNDALERLATFDPRSCRILELRFFGGLTIAETAGVLKLSHATVERDFKVAKSWLSRALEA